MHNRQDGRVGLRRQFQVLVRKGMGSNPILDNPYFYFCFVHSEAEGCLLFLLIAGKGNVNFR
jgi:hypothetical protein